jgi:hypothetical protein
VGFSEYDSAVGGLTEMFKDNIQKIESAAMGTDIIFPCRKLPI